MRSVQGQPGALEVADGDEREQPGLEVGEQPGHTQWEEEGQQVTKQLSNWENSILNLCQ